MVFVVTFLVKTFATVLAGIGFVVQMYPHVGIQSGAAIECFTAGLTFVGLL